MRLAFGSYDDDDYDTTIYDDVSQSGNVGGGGDW